MNDLLPVLAKFRLFTSQVLTVMFSSWVTMIPFAIVAVEEVGKLLKRLKQ